MELDERRDLVHDWSWRQLVTCKFWLVTGREAGSHGGTALTIKTLHLFSHLGCYCALCSVSNNPSDYIEARWSHPGFEDGLQVSHY